MWTWLTTRLAMVRRADSYPVNDQPARIKHLVKLSDESLTSPRPGPAAVDLWGNVTVETTVQRLSVSEESSALPISTAVCFQLRLLPGQLKYLP